MDSNFCLFFVIYPKRTNELKTNNYKCLLELMLHFPLLCLVSCCLIVQQSQQALPVFCMTCNLRHQAISLIFFPLRCPQPSGFCLGKNKHSCCRHQTFLAKKTSKTLRCGCSNNDTHVLTVLSTIVTLSEKTAAPGLLLSTTAATDDRFLFACHHKQTCQSPVCILRSYLVALSLKTQHHHRSSIFFFKITGHSFVLSAGCCHNTTSGMQTPPLYLT